MIVTQLIEGKVGNSQQVIPKDIKICYPCTITLLNRGNGIISMGGVEILSPVTDGATSQLTLQIPEGNNLHSMTFISPLPMTLTAIIVW